MLLRSWIPFVWRLLLDYSFPICPLSFLSLSDPELTQPQSTTSATDFMHTNRSQTATIIWQSTPHLATAKRRRCKYLDNIKYCVGTRSGKNKMVRGDRIIDRCGLRGQTHSGGYSAQHSHIERIETNTENQPRHNTASAPWNMAPKQSNPHHTSQCPPESEQGETNTTQHGS